MPKNNPEHTPVAPELPADSIDFNALHDACLKGLSPDDALAAAWDAHPNNIQPRELQEGEMLEDAGDPPGITSERIDAIDHDAA